MLKIDKTKIKKITLLSIEEAMLLPRWILSNGYRWWLKSPGAYYKLAAFVGSSGVIDVYGDYVDNCDISVRPVLKLDSKDSSNLEIGDLVEVVNEPAQYIGHNTVLIADPIGFEQFDENRNNYKTSKIRSWLVAWLKGNLNNG